ncbi:hypothetical protein BATDEDRAFT_85877 [Batrachochytrium dendrobatidis JAM81]|uniref:Phosducin domain-containing protein n=1 Tax=Batrachochytrium dendrobatidis (strain JAM81 / FGSC 10211) TaxID=684364 RepID=F4NRT6_BATDJ|nr:uncharacterized protein BATDEDRAFT_85877 [Batrachochytrium dendrobatidis JAM81]EGF83372.1 hypothetical protein BATDEDRAFT_85877 [Batrachochytrium dendrobatidis JAM81]|eukprot:XP_006676081.1 hypothetical protein BATDEDRAFT_85877 [Batrachochytrium dendrobatidis JAM81]
MNDMDEAIIRAIKQGSAPGQPDSEPFRMGSDIDSDENLSEDEANAANLNSQPVDPDMARLLEDSAIRQKLGVGGNFTGPKGVVNDYKFHKRQEQARAAARQQANEKKWSDQALSTGWMQRQILGEKNATSDPQLEIDHHSLGSGTLQHSTDVLDELEDDDEYIKEYRARRLLELKSQAMRPHFSTVYNLQQEDYVDVIDNEDPLVTVVIHLYKSTHDACRQVNTFLDHLATSYPTIKFAKIVSTVADESFDDVALPALLVYRAGALTHTLLRMTDEITGWERTGRVSFEDFEAYLWDMGVLKNSDSSLEKSLCRLTM